MTWPAIILFAVGAAFLTVLFLLFPVFNGTSFRRVGETGEARIFFAILIMANCKKAAGVGAENLCVFPDQPATHLLVILASGGITLLLLRYARRKPLHCGK